MLVPYCLGAVVGGIASGRVPAGGTAGDPWDSWVNPTSILGGVLAVCLTAYLAAFFLVCDAGRLSDEAMVDLLPAPGDRGRRRGRCGGAWSGSSCSSNDATYLFDGLTSRALPLVILSAICGLGGPRAARPSRSDRGARLAAVGAVVAVSSWPGGWRSGTTCCPSR